MKNFSVCCILLNYNSAEEAVELYNLLIGFEFERLKIIVVDNASAKGDISLLEKYIPKENLLLNAQNLGYAGGNNLGIRHALQDSYDYVWILNPDIRVEKETLPQLLQTAGKEEKIAAIGPRILRRENPNIIFSDGGEIKYNFQCTVRHKNFDKILKSHSTEVSFDIDYIDGSCILINLNAVKELGFLPEDYFLYFEETDWCVNAKRKGWKLAVNSRARAYNLDSRKGRVYFYHLFRNKMIFAKKYHPQPYFVKFYLLFTLVKQFFLHIFKIRRYWFWKDRMKGFLHGQKGAI